MVLYTVVTIHIFDVESIKREDTLAGSSYYSMLFVIPYTRERHVDLN